MRIIKDCGNDIWIIGLLKGSTFRTNGRVPDQAVKDQLVYVSMVQNLNGPGMIRELVPGKNVVMVVKGLHKKGHCCWDVLFVREDNNNDNGLKFVGPCDIPDKEVTVANQLLRKNSVGRRQSLDGFCGALMYSTEIAIPDTNSPTKMTGWILLIADYKQLMATGEVPKAAFATETGVIKPAVDPVAEAEKAAAKALAHLEAVRQAAALKSLVDNAVNKRAAATQAKAAADKAAAEAEEAKKTLSNKKAAAKTAAEAADAAEKEAKAAEAAAEAAKTVVIPAV